MVMSSLMLWKIIPNTCNGGKCSYIPRCTLRYLRKPIFYQRRDITINNLTNESKIRLNLGLNPFNDLSYTCSRNAVSGLALFCKNKRFYCSTLTADDLPGESKGIESVEDDGFFRVKQLDPVSQSEKDVGSLNTLADIGTPSLKDSFGGIIKIYCDSTDPNYAQPWQMRRQLKSIGSGFAIRNRMVVTNAHCVSWHNRCLLRKYGSTIKYPGRIIEIGHECDLAILTVDEDSFWEGIKPLELGGIPNLHDGVIVVGYPTGGDNLCITSGVVSRVDVTTYAHSNFRLLCAQIDAAINAGNSGGPAIKDGKVIGVAFQAYDEAQNIGYIIPTSIVQQFLRHIEKFNKYTGFVTIGITYQLLENPSMKSFLGFDEIKPEDLPEGVTASGILVCQCDRVLNPQNGLKTRDVIMQINGYDVADDGTVHFRDVERVHLAYALTDKFIGDHCDMTILRDKKIMNISVQLQNPNHLVAGHQWDIMPRYFIYGGLVFVPLTMEYLKDEFGKKFYEGAPSALLKPLSDIFASEKGQEVVVLSQILASDLTVGYDFRNIRLLSVDNMEIKNLKHLEEVLKGCTKGTHDASPSPFVKFHFENEIIIVLDRGKVAKTGQHILDQHAIPSHKSKEL